MILFVYIKVGNHQSLISYRLAFFRKCEGHAEKYQKHENFRFWAFVMKNRLKQDVKLKNVSKMNKIVLFGGHIGFFKYIFIFFGF